MEISISIEPTVKGIVKLSLIGVGRHSTNMPARAPINALIGSTKKTAPKKAIKWIPFFPEFPAEQRCGSIA